jgi:hypothetical protein
MSRSSVSLNSYQLNQHRAVALLPGPRPQSPPTHTTVSTELERDLRSLHFSLAGNSISRLSFGELERPKAAYNLHTCSIHSTSPTVYTLHSISEILSFSFSNPLSFPTSNPWSKNIFLCPQVSSPFPHFLRLLVSTFYFSVL